jgi:aspartyl-tRNA(Asn)/glutamyl-tRNA(Gln) amidotransferase subunit B
MSAKNLIEGNTGLWEPVIGLEVHAQVISKSKLFSGSSTQFGADPNNQVSFVDAAFPGMLPVLNEFCIAQAIKTGLGLHGEIPLVSVFDRKNYFYADLPSGYQITQFYKPIVLGGHLDIDTEAGESKRIRIHHIHLEQDAGKSLHDQHPSKSYIDLNRSGVALMEIVSEPDMRSSEEAIAYVKKLRTILRYLGTCDGNMDEGSMRVDANISVRRPGAEFGTRVEVKNVNSVRFLGQAIRYEIERQIAANESGEPIIQETRLFDPSTGQTRSMRTKEQAQDYRYFPDPDLPPVRLEQSYIDSIRQQLPELPDAKKQRFVESYGLTPYDAEVIVEEQETAAFFEASLGACPQPVELATGKMLANWLTGDFFAALNRDGINISKSPVSPQALAGLVQLIRTDVISGRIAKDVFVEMWQSGQSPEHIVETKGLRQVTDLGAIESVIDDVMSANADKVAEYRSGKDKLFGFFVGLVMKAMAGKGNPGAINQLLKNKLDGK